MEQVSKASIGKCTSVALWSKWAEWSVRANEQRVTKWLIKNVVIWTWKNVPCVRECVWNCVYEITVLCHPCLSNQFKSCWKRNQLPYLSSCPKFSFKSYGYKWRNFFLLSLWADACTKQMHGGLTDGWMDWHSLSWMSFDTLINFGLSHISLASVLFFFMASHLSQITYISRAGIWVSDFGFRPLGWNLDLTAGM